MDSILQVENLTKSFGDRILFANLSFGVSEGEKIGIIAKNGSGKSTLMSVLTGHEQYDSGKITFRNDLRIGYLEQVPVFNPESSVIDACLDNNDEVSAILKEYERAAMAGTDISNHIRKMDAANAWDYEDRFKQILSQLGIDDVNQPMGELSGGQQKRVAIARVLISNPDLLFLDEPTNHLDIATVEWLENYLSRSRITLLMVTHDRYFLDNVCNKIMEIDIDGVYPYKGNYDYYLEKRAERLEQQQSEVAKANNLLRKELDWMRRQPQARAGKAKYRIDAFYELKKKASNVRREENVKLNVQSGYIGNKIFEAHEVSKRYGDKVILDDFEYIFARFDKVGIVGENGVGKSTFVKMLQGMVKPDSGHFDVGDTVKFGYYGQEGIEFNNEMKVIDVAREIAEVVYFDEKNHYTAAQFLNLFLFSPADQQKYVYKLSGGEKRRLYLATVLMRKPNFLILDEPTNDLDIVTLEVLEDYIEKFKGCVIIISHDRFFMDRCINHLFVFEGNGVVKDFPGNYSEYREWRKEMEREKAQVQKASEQPKSKPTRERNNNRLTFKERKELERLTAEIDALNEEKKHLEAVFSGEEQTEDFDAASKRYNEVKDILDEKEMRWLELSEKE
ncbi:MAG: ABC-F family ATP-binding cassette domain-containing protein [Muribaculaceae bacterium]|nr:ABC-F family ATP-binding cassette domain-containing protein [Muribaculaceae bacterium]